jgi:gas vesicle protein
MRNDEGYGAISVMCSFLLGGIVGAGLALLFAPQSGREVRERISELAEDLKERTEDYVYRAKDTVSSKVQKGKELLGEKKSIIATAIEAGKEAYEKEKEKEKYVKEQ